MSLADKERLIAMLPPIRQAQVRKDMEVLKSLRLWEMTDAALDELHTAVSEEICRRAIAQV